MPYLSTLVCTLALVSSATTVLPAGSAIETPDSAHSTIVTKEITTPVALTAVTSQSNIANAVNIAMKQRGTRYKYGGESPGGFDCSGLVYYSFNKAGISMPRTSRAQRHVGTTIPRSQVQRGDLLHYSGHVAIAIGNGQLIEASKPGKPVATRAIYGKPMVKRVR